MVQVVVIGSRYKMRILNWPFAIVCDGFVNWNKQGDVKRMTKRIVLLAMAENCIRTVARTAQPTRWNDIVLCAHLNIISIFD